MSTEEAHVKSVRGVTITAAATALSGIATASAAAAAPPDAYVLPGQPGHEEVGAYAPGAVTKPDKGGKPGDVSAQAVNASTWNCALPWVTVQAEPSGYVIGNCQGGGSFLATQSSQRLGNGEQYYGGRVGGGFESCGWIRIDANWIRGGGLTQISDCVPETISKRQESFIRPGQVWTRWIDPYRADGVPVGNKNCTEYANFYPWSSGAYPVQPLRTPAEDQGYWKLRYTARWNDVNTGSAYDMIRNEAGPGNGNWAFVQDTCIKNKPNPTG